MQKFFHKILLLCLISMASISAFAQADPDSLPNGPEVLDYPGHRFDSLDATYIPSGILANKVFDDSTFCLFHYTGDSLGGNMWRQLYMDMAMAQMGTPAFPS